MTTQTQKVKPINEQQTEMKLGSEVIFTGHLVSSAVDTFTDKNSGEVITFGKVQLLMPQGDSENFKELTNIKAKEDTFGLLKILQDQYLMKVVKLYLTAVEYRGKTHFQLNSEQPFLQVAK